MIWSNVLPGPGSPCQNGCVYRLSTVYLGQALQAKGPDVRRRPEGPRWWLPLMEKDPHADLSGRLVRLKTAAGRHPAPEVYWVTPKNFRVTS